MDLTEEIHIEAVELGDEFWARFSQLCDETLDKLSDQQYRNWFESYLGDLTSIYGRAERDFWQKKLDEISDEGESENG